MKLVDGSNAIPLIFEENKSARMSQRQQSQISSLIRETYNAFEGQRGRPDQTIRVYRYQAPVCIVGETGFSEPAVLDRVVLVRLSKKDSAPHFQGFERVRQLPLGSLGRTLLETALSTTECTLKSLIEQELAAVDPRLTDRLRDNAATVRAGLSILGEVLEIEFDKTAVDCAVINGSLNRDSPDGCSQSPTMVTQWASDRETGPEPSR